MQIENYPNITAFQIIMLLSVGAPLTPAGGSSCNLVRQKNWDSYFYFLFHWYNRLKRKNSHIPIDLVTKTTDLLKSRISLLLAGVDIEIRVIEKLK